jgi:hypothetical protein
MKHKRTLIALGAGWLLAIVLPPRAVLDRFRPKG